MHIKVNINDILSPLGSYVWHHIELGLQLKQRSLLTMQCHILWWLMWIALSRFLFIPSSTWQPCFSQRELLFSIEGSDEYSQHQRLWIFQTLKLKIYWLCKHAMQLKQSFIIGIVTGKAQPNLSSNVCSVRLYWEIKELCRVQEKDFIYGEHKSNFCWGMFSFLFNVFLILFFISWLVCKSVCSVIFSYSLMTFQALVNTKNN